MVRNIMVEGHSRGHMLIQGWSGGREREEELGTGTQPSSPGSQQYIQLETHHCANPLVSIAHSI